MDSCPRNRTRVIEPMESIPWNRIHGIEPMASNPWNRIWELGILHSADPGHRSVIRGPGILHSRALCGVTHDPGYRFGIRWHKDFLQQKHWGLKFGLTGPCATDLIVDSALARPQKIYRGPSSMYPLFREASDEKCEEECVYSECGKKAADGK